MKLPDKKRFAGDLVRVFWIAHGPNITHREIASMTGLSRHGVTYHLKKYRQSKKVAVGPIPSRINGLIELDNHAGRFEK